MVFKVLALAISESYSVFLGLSHVYRKFTCYWTSVCFYPANLSFIRGGLIKEPRNVEGKIIFPLLQTLLKSLKAEILIPGQPHLWGPRILHLSPLGIEFLPMRWGVVQYNFWQSSYCRYQNFKLQNKVTQQILLPVKRTIQKNRNIYRSRILKWMCKWGLAFVPGVLGRELWVIEMSLLFKVGPCKGDDSGWSWIIGLD